MWRLSHEQLVITASAPSLRKSVRGRRLTKKAIFTAFFALSRGQSDVFGSGERVVRTGYRRIIKISNKLVVIIKGVVCIVSAWSCTKSFWFLRPADALLSFRSCE